MEENPAGGAGNAPAPSTSSPNNAGVPMETYHTLGNKTLAIFVIQRIQAALILLIVGLVLLVLEGQSFLSQIPIPNFGQYVGLAAETCFILFGFFFIFAFLIAWLIYINYKYMLSADSLKILRGILNKEEIAIPYRQIQDVDIDRNLSLRMMGVSRIVILTAGHEDGPGSKDDPDEHGQSEGYLPALDRDLAEWLRDELLRRTNVQKVVEVKENI
jgi:uncharacterized membrane protein YdbT with pleckstrin-like domain